MNRLQQKCLVAALGFHLLMVVILLIGPAFLARNDKSDNRPLIDFVPLKTIDEALSGGGNPNARPPVPQPQAPAPQPRVQAPAPQPEPQVRQPAPPKTAEREPDALPAKLTRKLPDVSLKPKQRAMDQSSSKKAATKSASTSDADNRLALVAKAAQQAARSLQQNVSGSTPVDVPAGPGGGGASYANFFDAVKKIYFDAWIAPDGAADEDASVEASVTIARNGDVVSSRIVKTSGNAAVDQSVLATLNRVRRAVPLPDGVKEEQRIVPIKFNARATRGSG